MTSCARIRSAASADEVLKENEKELVGAASANAREQIKGTFVLLRIAEEEKHHGHARGIARAASPRWRSATR